VGPAEVSFRVRMPCLHGPETIHRGSCDVLVSPFPGQTGSFLMNRHSALAPAARCFIDNKYVEAASPPIARRGAGRDGTVRALGRLAARTRC